MVVLKFNGDGGVVERGIDVVDWDRVVGVGGVARDINDHTQFAARLSKELVVDKRRDRLG